MLSASLTGEERPNPEHRPESCFRCDPLILKTLVDCERVGKHHRLFAGDPLVVVEVPDHLHEMGRVARVLADAGVHLGVCLVEMLGSAVAVVDRRGDRGLSLGLALRCRLHGCAGT
jgi:hypothetical protein